MPPSFGSFPRREWDLAIDWGFVEQEAIEGLTGLKLLKCAINGDLTWKEME